MNVPTAAKSVQDNADNMKATVTPTATGWDSSGLAKESGGHLAAIDGKLPTLVLGPRTAATSISVTPASGMSAARLTNAAVSVSAAGDSDLVAADGSKVVRVYRLVLVVSAPTNIIIKQGATALTGAIPLQTGGALVLDFTCEEPWFTGAAGAAIKINSSVAVTIAGLIGYTQA